MPPFMAGGATLVCSILANNYDVLSVDVDRCLWLGHKKLSVFIIRLNVLTSFDFITTKSVYSFILYICIYYVINSVFKKKFFLLYLPVDVELS